MESVGRPALPSVEVEQPELGGKTVGEYLLVRRIGRGGMGLVYEGVQPVIGKKVAVKFLLPELSADERLVRQFVTEARLVNAIAHRGIVDIFSFGQFMGMQYFVMEFLEGRPFDLLVADEAPLSEALAVQYLSQMLDALGAAHRAGVIHRDVKPSNVFLVEHKGERPYVKLLDFGIAKSGGERGLPTLCDCAPLSRQSLVVGTPEYIAPEQAQGLPIGPWTDLYSAGCVAFELLTGRLPHEGNNPLETMFKHVTDPTPRVSDVRPVTPQLDEFIYSLMAKEPAGRPASAAEALEQLEQLCATLEVQDARATAELRAISGPRPQLPSTLSPTWPTMLQKPKRSAPRTRLAMGLALMTGLLAGLYLFAPEAPKSEAAPPPKPPEEPAPPPSSSYEDGVLPDEDTDPELAMPAGGAARLAEKAVAEKLTVELPRRPGPAPSEEALDAHLSSLHLKLARKETARGERLDVLRLLLETAERRRVAATTAAQRKEIGATLDDLDRLLAR